MKEFELSFWVGGSVGYVVIGGGVYNATIMDLSTGESTLYKVKVFGIGVGLPSFRGSAKPIRFKIADNSKRSSDFDGYGYIGGASLEVGGGAKFGGGIKIPGGPFISGDLIAWDQGGFDVGVSHSVAHWSH